MKYFYTSSLSFYTKKSFRFLFLEGEPGFFEKENFLTEFKDLLADLQEELDGEIKIQTLTNCISVQSWENKTSILNIQEGISIKELDLLFPDTEDGWDEATRTATLFNFLKDRCLSSKGVDSRQPEVLFDDKGNLIVFHVYPSQEVGMMNRVFNDSATTLLSVKGWEKFPVLSRKKNFLLDSLNGLFKKE